MTNDIIPNEPEKDVSYAELQLKILIEKSLKKMDDLEDHKNFHS